jgi:hypothetical protein
MTKKNPLLAGDDGNFLLVNNFTPDTNRLDPPLRPREIVFTIPGAPGDTITGTEVGRGRGLSISSISGIQ